MSRGIGPASLFSGTQESGRRRWNLATFAWLPVFAGLGLSLLGISTIALTRPELAARQGMFLFVGLLAALIAVLPHPRFLRVACWALCALVLGLLVFVLLPFAPASLVTPRNGARAWIALGAFDLQPSELAKIAFILCLAQWLSLRASPRTLRSLIVPALLFIVPVALIVLEPDLGSALLFGPTLLAMLIAAGARWMHLGTVLVLAVCLVPLGYFTALKPYQQARIDAIIAQVRGDTRFENDIGFQGWRAMRLVGSGGVFGNEESHARALVKLNALPEEHNDMVFAVVCCRFGLLGGALVWGLSALYAAGAFLVAAGARDGFSKLVAVGIGSIVFAQTFVNTGMTIGILPITGVTLPFVSYGGSSLVASWIMTGVLFGLGVHRAGGGEKDRFDE
ncbi:MAG: hypothetical protein EXS10_10620 [Phycisphaerales bacterium]|nr:hypothetical protein [Phycisphaerales bacterium]